MDTWGFSWGCSFQTNTSETHFCFRCLSSLAINLPHTLVMALNDLLNRYPVLTSTLQRANISYWSGEQVEQVQKSLLLRSSVTVVSRGQLVQTCGDAITAWMFEGHCIAYPTNIFVYSYKYICGCWLSLRLLKSGCTLQLLLQHLCFSESPSQMFLSGYYKVLFSCKRKHFYNSTWKGWWALFP